jgi:general transcriptional corepressor CYC8
MPVQTSAPLPQDVHPQAYQATGAVGPPGPQWGNSAPPPPPGPPNGPVNGWGSRLAEINPPPQPSNPYDQREPARGPIPPPPRGPSPRQEQQMRPYPGPGPGPERGPPPPPPRRSPPRDMPVSMGVYPPPPGQGGPHGPPPQSGPSGPPPPRVSNPNYAGPTGSSSSATLPPAPSSLNGSGGVPPIGRGNSPRPEVRPISLDNRMASPKTGYPHQQPQYPHHPDISNPGGIAGGAPPPASALAAQEAAAERERDGERPASVGPKRMREWEDEQPSMKKPASDENRARMEDTHHRRPSTPEPFRRSSSEARRAEDQRRMEDQRRVDEQRRAEDQRRVEDQRRANENYHPSEVAHHPPMGLQPNHLPPMGGPPGPPGPPAGVHTPVHELPPPAPKEYAVDERERERERLDHPPPPPPVGEPERAARKMDVDEDYDDDGDEDKKGGIVSATRSGPGSSSGEAKATSPSGVNGHGANGVVNGGPKVETPA